MPALVSRRPLVAVLPFTPVSVFETALPFEVFGIDRSAMGVPGYDVRLVSGEEGPLRSDMGFSYADTESVTTLRRATTIIIPGWGRGKWMTPSDEVLDELRRAYHRGARLVSLCSGAFVLAAAGLLDGRRATTHWMYTDEMLTLYPQVKLDPAVLYVGDGNVWTSAGTAAGIDLCLHLLRLDHGAEVANVVARRMVVPPHRDGGQMQYVETPLPPTCTDDSLARTLEWAQGELGHPHTVESLARRAKLSPRTFARRFRAATGTTPLQWLLTQRVVQAQRLLETSDLPIEHVAQQCGFGSAATLRQHFGRVVGTSPMSYRLTFRQAS